MSTGEYGNLGNYLAQTISGGGGSGGDASAANQETQITTLDSIDAKLPVLVGGKIPVDIASNITVEVTNTSIEVSNDAGNPIPISDNGGSITVDSGEGTITIDGAITANAGTNLNTSLLALEAGNLADILSKIPTDLTVTATRLLTDNGQNQPLTDTQLRAANVGITGTVIANIGTGNLTGITDTVIVKADTLVNQTNPFKVDGSAVTQPVSLASLPALATGSNVIGDINNISGTISLPTGAATSGNQTTANSSLSSIDGKLPILGQALAAASVPIVLTSSQLNTLTPPSNSSLALESGGNLASINTKTPDLINSKVPSLNYFQRSNLSAFGDIISNPDKAVIQFDFLGNVIETYHIVATASIGATVDQTGGMLRLQSGAGISGSALARSAKIAKYRPGQGMKIRFTRIYQTGVANNTQITGIGSSTDGYFFGFDNTSFGILHRNNSVNTWIPQTSWNVDKLDGTGAFTLDPTKGNVYQIVYPYLGFGSIHFFVESPTGDIVHVHTIQYPNSVITTQLSNPNLYFYAENVNTGNNTNVIGYVGSVGVFLSGDRSFLGSPFATSSIKTVSTTRTNLFTLKAATTFNGIENRRQLRPNRLSFAWDNFNGNATLEIIRNTTLGGTPSFAAINGTTANAGVTITAGQSMISVDTAGTTTTGGSVFYNIGLARNSSVPDDLTTSEFFLSPSETWTFAVTGTGSGSALVTLNWKED